MALSIVDDSGTQDATGTLSVINQPGQPPVAQTNGHCEGEAGVTLYFTASGATDPYGNMSDFAWDFG